jgi:hypothetical protein
MVVHHKMLSAEFIDFYHNWQSKAAAYSDEDLRSAFDKFFTLFVLYNRLYAAASWNSHTALILVLCSAVPRFPMAKPLASTSHCISLLSP